MTAWGQRMRVYSRIVHWLTISAAVAATIGLLVLTLLLSLDLFGRNLFGFTTMFANEWSGYTHAGVIFLAAPIAFLKGEHIRVELVDTLTTGRLRRGMHILALVLSTFIAAYLCYALGKMMIESFLTDRRATWVLRTPLWIPQAALFTGSAILLLAVIERLLVSALPTRRGH